MMAFALVPACCGNASAQDAPFVRDVFNRINAERKQQGLKPCAYNKTLEKSSGWKAGHPGSHTETIVRSWMNSPGHRKEILTGHYQEMGIGVACTPDANYDTFWCVVFGDPTK